MDELIENFEYYAEEAVSGSPERVEIAIASIDTIVHCALPGLKPTPLTREVTLFYESLLWNARRVLREPSAVSSIRANARGIQRLRAPRAVRVEAEVRTAWG